MKRLLTLLAFVSFGPIVSLGCEGEPPVMAPENPPGTASEVAAASAQPSGEPAPPTAASMTACPPPPCTPVASAGPAASATSSAADASSAAALPVPPASIPRGNIVGAVTTRPAALQSQTIVYLEDGPKEDVPSHLQTITIANRQMNFIPYVAVAAVGGKVVFTNEDPFPHNVFSPDNEKFNMGNIPQNGAHFRVFRTLEHIRCFAICIPECSATWSSRRRHGSRGPMRRGSST